MVFQNDEERRAYYRAYNKNWYLRHKYRLREKQKLRKANLRKWLEEYKSNLRCKVCGEGHPACLQFHHRDPTEKNFTIGGFIGRWKYVTLKQLKDEISKCDILCGNCHAKLHWTEIHMTADGDVNNAI